jgi:hypothetical protein
MRRIINRPPNNTDAEYLGTLESYLARIPMHNGAHLWLGGDFNLPGIYWTNENIEKKPKVISQISMQSTSGS